MTWRKQRRERRRDERCVFVLVIGSTLGVALALAVVCSVFHGIRIPL